MATEWSCRCKDCGAEFSYSNTTFQSGKSRGWSRPERCGECRKRHAREIQSIGQAFHKVHPLRAGIDHLQLTSAIGRFRRAERKHEEIVHTPAPLDENKFGIKDDKLVEMFHLFIHDPGLQVVVVVGPTGSGKSTFFPYRLVEPPRSYKDKQGVVRDTYWTAPILSGPEAGLARWSPTPLDDPGAVCHQVRDIDEKFFHRYGQIVVTQPRIQATRSIPAYIAKAMLGSSLGAGFDIGFRHAKSPCSDWNTKLAFVTDGTLINWISQGQMDKIGTVMIDEAHERSLNIDIIIGLLTQMLPRYPRLKVIIASATISADKFIQHFDRFLPARFDAQGNKLPNCRLMEFEGKSFKVSPHFRRSDEPPLDYQRVAIGTAPDGEPLLEGRYGKPQDAWQDVAVRAVELLEAMYDPRPEGGYLIDHAGAKIDLTERRGDVLCFLQGEKPIQNCIRRVEDLVRERLRDKVKVEALPLYTTLPQSEQDKALSERPSVHRSLVARVVAKLEAMLRSAEAGPHGDILAIHDNAGQIDEVVALIQQQVDGRAEWAGIVGVYPWYTSETATQLFESMPERAVLALPVKGAVPIRVVISTTRARAAFSAGDFEHRIEQEEESRRVIASTNVAETSLTIHGILHVVDSGLINQNKWDAQTQTSAISPILQSRAGCKQRWGRAGRLQAGDAWPLYTEAQFGQEQGEKDNDPERTFEFYSRPEIQRSPLEQVMLTAKQAGVDSLDPAVFPWIDPPDFLELERARCSLEQKGALDPDGDLTEHGLEIGRYREEAKIANLILVADRFACAVEMATLLGANQAQFKRLFRFQREWDDRTTKEVQAVQQGLLSGCRDDLEATMKIVACWDRSREAGVVLVELGRWMRDWIDRCDRLERRAGPVMRRVQTTGATLASLETLTPVLSEARRAGLERDEIATLRQVAERGLELRSRWKRHQLEWANLASTWAWQEAWETTVLRRIRQSLLRDALLRIYHPREPIDSLRRKAREMVLPNDDQSMRREDLKLAGGLMDKLRQVRDAGARRRYCEGFVARMEGRLSFGRMDRGMEDFLRLASEIRTPRALVKLFEIGEANRWHDLLNRICRYLPLVAPEAWARLYYLDAIVIRALDESRATLLEPLEAHKKGEERRPLDLARTDKLRAILAHALPDQCYFRAGEQYAPVGAGAEDETDEKAQGAPTSIEVAIDNGSVCSGTQPSAFVCLSRRASTATGPGADAHAAKLHTSFLAILPESWHSRLRGKNGSPLYQANTSELLHFIKEHCVDEPEEQWLPRLLLGQRFPFGSVCPCKVVGRGDGHYLVEISAPSAFPTRIVERMRKAGTDVEGDDEDGIEERVRGDLALTEELRELEVSEDPDDAGTAGEVRDSVWEEIYAFKSSGGDWWSEPVPLESSVADGAAPAANVEKTAAGITAASVVGGERVSPQAKARTSPTVADAAVIGKLETTETLKEGETIQAEVLAEETGEGLRVRYPTTRELFAKFLQVYSDRDIGASFNVAAVRLEQLPFGYGAVLVVRELKTGLEIKMGPRDLSFSTARCVPELVFAAVGRGTEFSVTLFQIDREASRVRVTSHGRFPELFPTAADLGMVDIRVLEHTPNGPFVQIIDSRNPEAHGFTLVTRLPEGSFPGTSAGVLGRAFLAFRKKTKENWPDSVEPDDPALSLEFGQIIHRGPVSQPTLLKWMAQVDDAPSRAALYSLYERSHELDAVDEAAMQVRKDLANQLCEATVRSVNDHGAVVTLSSPAGGEGWLAKQEITWIESDDKDAWKLSLVVGSKHQVRILETPPTKDQLAVSIRLTQPNPYAEFKPGDYVEAKVHRVDEEGLELRMDGLHLRLGVQEYAATLKEKAYADLAPGDALCAIIISVVPEKMRIFVSRKALVKDAVRNQCGGKCVSAMVVHVKQNGARLALGHGLDGWLDAGETSWDRIDDMRQMVKVGQTIQCVIKAEAGRESDDLRLSIKVLTKIAYRVSGKVGLFRGGGSANLRNVEQSIASTTGRKIFISFPRDQDAFEVRGDAASDVASAARMLEALASQKSCYLQRLSEDVQSAKLENVAVPHRRVPTRKSANLPPTIQAAKAEATVKPRTVLQQPSRPHAPAKPNGIFERVLNWLKTFLSS